MERLLRKHNAAKTKVPAPIIELRSGATFGVVTVGGCDLAVREALETLASKGLKGDFMRVRAFPFSEEVEKFLVRHDQVFIVEQNRDMQLRSLLTIETPVEKHRLRSVTAWGGFPLQAQEVIVGIAKQLETKAS
jgi:2-oxoglutarate ferredoxin oxidoreductase subunit alpha